MKVLTVGLQVSFIDGQNGSITSVSNSGLVGVFHSTTGAKFTVLSSECEIIGAKPNPSFVHATTLQDGRTVAKFLIPKRSELAAPVVKASSDVFNEPADGMGAV